MSLFRNKVKVSRDNQGENCLVFLDYRKVCSPLDFLSDILKDFIGLSKCIAIIDSGLSYNEAKASDHLKKLYQYLEEQKLTYTSVENISDYQRRYMGIPITSEHTKKKHHRIGILLTQEDILPLLKVNKLNTHYYIGLNSENPIGLLHSFQMAKGEVNILEASSDYQLYVDHYLSRLRIMHRKELTDEVEGILQRYEAL